MANDITQVPISGLEGASAANAQDLLEIAKVNAQAETGYDSKSITISVLALALANSIQFISELQTENKTLIGAINELKQRVDALEG